MPCQSSNSAQATEDSGSESTLPPAEALAASVTWRGKLSPRRIWSKRWKRVSWLRRLSGLTSPPSTLSSGVAAWTSSLLAFLASRSASPAKGEGSKTSGGSGRPSRASFAWWDQASSCWRTSQDCLLAGPTTYSETLPSSGSMRSGRLSERPTLGRRISGPGSSFSRGVYPTPAASAYGSSQTGSNSDRPSAGTPSLETWAKGWPTPTARDHTSTQASAETHARNSRPLSEFVGNWPTPTASDRRRSGSEGYGGQKFQTLTDATVRSPPGHLAPATPTDGEPTLGAAALNPRFVEALLGLPIGLIGCDCSATELYRWRLLMRSELSRLGR